MQLLPYMPSVLIREAEATRSEEASHLPWMLPSPPTPMSLCPD